MRRFVSVFVLLLLAAAYRAEAAPQIMAVAATDGPVPLNCAGGVCKAEFSSVCLQPNRDNPVSGTRYDLVGETVWLVLTDGDGSQRRLRPQSKVRVDTVRTYTSVELSVPRHEIGDAVAVALEVTKFTAAMPRPVADDPKPLGQGEVSMITGPGLEIAAQTLRRQDGAVVAAGIMMRMLNDLATGPTKPPDDLWRRASSVAPPDHPGVPRARAAFVLCRSVDSTGRAGFLRGCLIGRHDGLMAELTSKVWRQLRPGS
jgi:hypothetical protein